LFITQPQHRDRNNVSIQDFTNRVLGDVLKLKEVVTENISRLMVDAYMSYDRDSIEIDKFFDDLSNTASMIKNNNKYKALKIRVYMTQSQI
jgi:hypothetical protein